MPDKRTSVKSRDPPVARGRAAPRLSSQVSEEALQIPQIGRSGLQEDGVNLALDGRFLEPPHGCHSTLGGTAIQSAGDLCLCWRQPEQPAQQVGIRYTRCCPEIPQQDQRLARHPPGQPAGSFRQTPWQGTHKSSK